MLVAKNIHTQVITEWESEKAQGLTLEQHVVLFEKAIWAIQKRACKTLSIITMSVILDRVLHQSKGEHLLLSEIKITENKLNFTLLIKAYSDRPEVILEALRYLLLELFTILGRITSDILTQPIHSELRKVNWNDPEDL